MRALIVDDEPLARRELRRLLSAFDWVEIAGEASDVDEARERILAQMPDVVFLDVQMPGGSGFDLLAQLERVPRVIFTTAYDHYAVKAFDVSALDYLLKPIEPERLAAALGKVQLRALQSRAAGTGSNHSAARNVAGVAGQGAPTNDTTAGTIGARVIDGFDNSTMPAGPLEQLFVRDGPRCWFVPLREVSVFTAEGNYVRLQWGKVHPLLGRSLIALEEKLDSRRFFRANRRQIVNLELIESVELGAGGRLHVQLRDGPEIEISRRQARLFRARSTV
jgi:two-component system LytT family response regulator